MSERAQALAERFERANDAFIQLIEELTPDQWATECPDERRTVAALAHHVAVGYAAELAAFQAMADERPVDGWTRASLDRVNAEDGAEYAACDQDETIALLRQNGATAAAWTRGLTDEQLERSGAYLDWLPAWTVADWIERILIGHINMHAASIRATLAGAPAHDARQPA